VPAPGPRLQRRQVAAYWCPDPLEPAPPGRLVVACLGRQFSVMPSVLEFEVRRLRAMSASDKVAALHALWQQAWALTAAGVRGRHPEWSPPQVDAEVRRVFLRESS